MPDLYIDGSWTAGSNGATAPVINPFDGSVIQEVDQASRHDVERAVAAAKAAFSRAGGGPAP